jgi:hypothetical protein
MNAELSALTQRTLALFKDATTAGIAQNTGLVYYDLESQAKRLYPVLTPLRNQTARVNKPSGYGTAAHWKAITGINTGSPATYVGVQEGKRGMVMSLTEKDYTATYKGIGIENQVTFEGQYAGEGFDDMRALAQITTLEALMLGEEQMLLSGNSGTALAQVTFLGTPGVAAGSDGSFGAVPVYCFCVALTPLGVALCGGANGFTTAAIAAGNSPNPSFSQTSAGPYSNSQTVNGGVGQISAQATVTPGATQHITWSVNPVQGAAGYAWYIGTTTGAANCSLVGITDIPIIVTPSLGTAGNQKANATGLSADHSTNATSFDGFTTQLINGGGYYKSLAGAKFTSDTHGGIVEIDAMFQSFWDNYRLWVDELWVGSKLAQEITQIVLSGTSNPVYNIIMPNNNDGQGTVTAGALVTSYLNKFSMEGAKQTPIRLHPNMPSGWLFANLKHVPYPNANIPGVARVVTRQEYYSKEWPVIQRTYEYGVYADEVLQLYVPFGLGLIQDVA